MLEFVPYKIYIQLFYGETSPWYTFFFAASLLFYCYVVVGLVFSFIAISIGKKHIKRHNIVTEKIRQKAARRLLKMNSGMAGRRNLKFYGK